MGIAVDADGFSSEMDAQRRRSKDSREDIDLTAAVSFTELAGSAGPTTFTGYGTLRGNARIVALLSGGAQVDSASAGDKVELLLDATPFYAEAGGQVGSQPDNEGCRPCTCRPGPCLIGF